MLFDLVDGAAGDEITMRRNEAALAAMELVPTLLAGAPKRDQSVELFGEKLRSPVIIGPTGFAGLMWPRAEIETARAAARFGTIYSTSHASLSSLEEIGAATQGPKWMQTFLYKDRGLTKEFAARAAAAGYHGLILTVDNQVVAGRDRDARNGASFPLRWGPRRVADFASRPGWLMRMRATPSPRFANYGARSAMAAFGPLMLEQLDPDIGWHDVDWLRKLVARAAHPQRHSAPGRGGRGGEPRRRRDHRLQPWRTAARRRGRLDPGAARHCRGGRRAGAGACRWRFPARN